MSLNVNIARWFCIVRIENVKGKIKQFLIYLSILGIIPKDIRYAREKWYRKT